METFQSKQTIPFASFVYFSHEENNYLNDAMSTIRDAEAFVRNQTKSEPIVLYPGETWEIGTPHDNAAALAQYDADYDLTAKPLHRAESVSLDEVKAAGEAFIQRMQQKNSGLFMTLMGLPPLRYFQPFTLYLTDLEQLVRFDMTTGVQTVAGGAADADVQLAAESLAYVLRHDWGYDTLEVNGRFRATPEGHKRMVKTFFLGPLNNTGRYLHPKTLFEPSFLRRALGKLRSLG
ncbi:MAG: hypothetical protein R2932_05205 [Caldilineaceae bacterium]